MKAAKLLIIDLELCLTSNRAFSELNFNPSCIAMLFAFNI